MLLSPRDVPTFLQDSAFFRSLDVPSEEFEVLQMYVKPDKSLKVFDDLIWLLHTIRFWGTDASMPVEIMKFILYEHQCSSNERCLLESTFPEYWSKLYELFEVTDASSKIITAMTSGFDLSVIRFLHEHVEKQLTADMCQQAAHLNRLDCLMYFHEQSAPWDSYTTSAALKAGYLECYKYAESHGCAVCELVIVRDDLFII